MINIFIMCPGRSPLARFQIKGGATCARPSARRCALVSVHPTALKVRLDGDEEAFLFDGATGIPLSPERFDYVGDKARAKRATETARRSGTNRNGGDAATAETKQCLPDGHGSARQPG